jgi:hypothetical protein
MLVIRNEPAGGTIMQIPTRAKSRDRDRRCAQKGRPQLTPANPQRSGGRPQGSSR